MTLPKTLYEQDKHDKAAAIVRYAQYIASAAQAGKYMGENLKPFVSTLTRMAEAATEFDRAYAKDFFTPEDPGVRSMSQLKVAREAR